jgi:hypothetical protein
MPRAGPLAREKPVQKRVLPPAFERPIDRYKALHDQFCTSRLLDKLKRVVPHDAAKTLIYVL